MDYKCLHYNKEELGIKIGQTVLLYDKPPTINLVDKNRVALEWVYGL
jgi:hypothetical protein